MIDRKDLTLAFSLALLLMSLYGLTSSGHIGSADGEVVYLVTESLVERSTFAVETVETETPLALVPGRNGEQYAVTGPLQSLLAIPLYLAGRGVASFFPALFEPFFTRFFVAFFNVPVTAATAALLYLFGVDLGYQRRTSLVTALAFGLGTVAWPYARTFFAESLHTFWLVFAAWAFYRYRRDERMIWSVAVGVALALGFATKYVMMVAGPAFLFYGTLLWLRQGRRQRRGWFWRTVLGVGIPFLVLLSLLILFNYMRFGHFFETGYTRPETRGPISNWGTSAQPLVNWYGYFLSSGKGFFFFSPPAFLALWGWRALCRRHKLESLLFTGIILSYPLFYSLVTHLWFGGVNWGPRYIVCTTPFALLPLGAFLERRDLKRWLIGGGTIVFLCLGVTAQIPNLLISYTTYALSDTPLEQQLFFPEKSPLSAHWQLWRQQWVAWRTFDHELRTSGEDFYLIDSGFHAIEVPEQAPYGRWMDSVGKFYIYAHPRRELLLSVTYARPKNTSPQASDWRGLRWTYDAMTFSGERYLLVENVHETQWQEVVRVPAPAVSSWPGELRLEAPADVPGDERALSVFVSDVEFLQDGEVLAYRDVSLPRPLPPTIAYGWDWNAVFWFYDPAVPRPLDLWMWYVWTSGVRLSPARGLIATLVALWCAVLLTGFVILGAYVKTTAGADHRV